MNTEIVNLLEIIAKEPKDQKVVTLYLKGGAKVTGRLISLTASKETTRLYLDSKNTYIATTEIIAVETDKEV